MQKLLVIVLRIYRACFLLYRCLAALAACIILYCCVCEIHSFAFCILTFLVFVFVFLCAI